MGEDMNKIIGAIYLEGKRILDVEEMQGAEIESVTYDPEQGEAIIEGFRPLGTVHEIQMTFTTKGNFINRRLINKLSGWKNYDKPRKRMLKKAQKLRYRRMFFITAKRLERLLRRHKEQARRRWMKTGYDPVWHYTEVTENENQTQRMG